MGSAPMLPLGSVVTNAIVYAVTCRGLLLRQYHSLQLACALAATFNVSFSTADVSSHLDPNCAPGASRSERCHFPNMLHTV